MPESVEPRAADMYRAQIVAGSVPPLIFWPRTSSIDLDSAPG
ncbi:MAG TPA: hypothetical protein VE990_00625 [Acidimicrobiales bacterium]|nr:hypothetical protein [Acidimicrobiales bacterium]